MTDLSTSNSPADLAAELLREGNDLFRALVLMRRAGASVRGMAKCVGLTKSEMGRWLPVIEAGVSQLGQGDGSFTSSSSGDLSRTGQGHAEPAS
jgi:hypothetical protein